MTKEKLKRLKESVLDFVVPVPERFSDISSSATIRIKFVNGEYVYIPRKHTFGRGVILSEDELRMIVDKLEELNEK